MQIKSRKEVFDYIIMLSRDTARVAASVNNGLDRITLDEDLYHNYLTPVSSNVKLEVLLKCIAFDWFSLHHNGYYGNHSGMDRPVFVDKDKITPELRAEIELIYVYHRVKMKSALSVIRSSFFDLEQRFLLRNHQFVDDKRYAAVRVLMDNNWYYLTECDGSETRYTAYTIEDLLCGSETNFSAADMLHKVAVVDNKFKPIHLELLLASLFQQSLDIASRSRDEMGEDYKLENGVMLYATRWHQGCYRVFDEVYKPIHNTGVVTSFDVYKEPRLEVS